MDRGGLGRCGMSPLIATILLMAFAVALGGMIMNWSIDLSSPGECDAIHVSVSQFCTDGDSIILKARSAADSTPLQRVDLLVSGSNVEQQVKVRNSAVGPGAALELRIPFAAGNDAAVSLLGVVGPDASPYVCEATPIEKVDPIQPC